VGKSDLERWRGIEGEEGGERREEREVISQE